MDTSTLLEGKELSIGYRSGKRQQIVQSSLNFQLHSGELTCLLGANGAGKSTLLRTLAAAQPSLGGTLTLQGKALKAYSTRERSRMLGLVLTDKTYTGGLTVREVASLGRQPYTGFFGKLTSKDREAVEQALQATGIAHKATDYMAYLSDGERQKVMIAKALAQECPVILLDEPTAFLDVVSRIEILSLLHRLAAEEHKAILLSTHEVEQALVLADRLWLLSPEGLTCGVTEDLVLHHDLTRLFPTDTVRFDDTIGAYFPVKQNAVPIVLEAPNMLLEHWAHNALSRRGYRCLPAKECTAQTLRVISPNHLILQSDTEETRHFTSFEDLFAQALPNQV